MTDYTIACVWTGTKYPVEYVEKLATMVDRHLPRGDTYRFVVLTDRPHEVDHDAIDVSRLGLPGWWAKLALFDPELRDDSYWYYLDLDTVVVGDLTPLVRQRPEFGVCRNFARLAGAERWPCRYGSCLLGLAPGWGGDVWRIFNEKPHAWMDRAGRYGDQLVLDWLAPTATFWQDVLPPGFLLNKRDLHQFPEAAPSDTSLVVFGGRSRPDNCSIPWVRDAWR